MFLKLIVYQLDDYVRDYPNISEHIKNNPSWIKIMERVWIIKTRKSSSQVRNELVEAINSKGKVFVVDVTNSAWGSYAIDSAAAQWLKELYPLVLLFFFLFSF